MLTVTHTVRDRVSFERWVKEAKQGDVCLYHTGFLINDREAKDFKTIPIKEVAAATLVSSQRGFVILMQRRLGPEMYDYFAVRTSKGVKQPEPQPEAALAV